MNMAAFSKQCCPDNKTIVAEHGGVLHAEGHRIDAACHHASTDDG